MPYIRDSFWRGREFGSCRACRPRPSAGAARSRACGPAGRWKGPARSPSSKRPSRAGWRRCRGRVRARGVAHRQGRPRHPRLGGQDALLGALAPHREEGRRAGGRAHRRGSSSTAKVVKTRVGKGGARSPTPPTSRPRRWPFFMRTPAWCRRRAAEVGPSVGAWSTSCSRSPSSTGSARPRVCCAWPTTTTPDASTPPVPGPSWSGTRPIDRPGHLGGGHRARGHAPRPRRPRCPAHLRGRGLHLRARAALRPDEGGRMTKSTASVAVSGPGRPPVDPGADIHQVMTDAGGDRDDRHQPARDRLRTLKLFGMLDALHARSPRPTRGTSATSSS